MNWVDLVIILILALYALHGWQRGFLLLALDFVGFAISLAGALFLYRYAGSVLSGVSGWSRNLSNAAAFLALFFVAQIVFWLLVRKIYRRVPKFTRDSRANHMLGMLPAVAKGFVLCSLAVMLLVTLPAQIPKSDILRSKIGGPMVRLSSAIELAAAPVLHGAIHESLTFLTIKPDAVESMEIRAQTADVDVDFQAESRMVRMVNKERAARGLRPLRLDASLRTLARSHSRDMFARGYFGHVNPDGEDPFARMRKAGIEYLEAGENLAMAPSVAIAHDGLMKSPGHRANILDPKFGRIGIGVYSSEIYGKMFTQEFRD